MTPKQIQAEKVAALFWRLVGQAFVAYPDECMEICNRHKAMVGPYLSVPDGAGYCSRGMADAVEEIAQKYPKLAFTHL